LKKLIPKKGWWSDSRCKPWVQTPELKKKKKRKENFALLHKILRELLVTGMNM
jgi:hypothetical protein